LKAVALPRGYRVYRTLLARYEASRSPALRAAFEKTVAHAVRLAGRRGGLAFPPAAPGSGFRWAWQWRLETVAGWNEMASVAWCRRWVSRGMTVVDAGAHIGYYTRLFARWVGPAGRVLAFEPHPHNFALLSRNAALPNVECHQLAVGARSGTALLHLSAGSSNHSLVPGYTEPRGQLAVEVVALDDWLHRGLLSSVGLIKLDVEGGEPAALAGLAGLLAASPRAALLVEVNAAALAAAGSDPRELVERVRALGRVPERVCDDGRLVPADRDPTGPEGVANLFCRPRGFAAATTS
jgi:FkbM family methyltransferase